MNSVCNIHSRVQPCPQVHPLKRGRIIGLRETGLICRRIAAHIRHNVSAFSSGLWNIPTLLDQVLDDRVLQTHVKIEELSEQREVAVQTTSREEIRAHVAPAVLPTVLPTHTIFFR